MHVLEEWVFLWTQFLYHRINKIKRSKKSYLYVHIQRGVYFSSKGIMMDVLAFNKESNIFHRIKDNPFKLKQNLKHLKPSITQSISCFLFLLAHINWKVAIIVFWKLRESWELFSKGIAFQTWANQSIWSVRH